MHPTSSLLVSITLLLSSLALPAAMAFRSSPTLFRGTRFAASTFNSLKSSRLSISDTFDGGNIALAGLDEQGFDSVKVSLEIKPDVFTELEKTSHMQYFCFRATTSNDRIAEANRPLRVTYSIDNASKVSYPKAWEGSTVFYSTNVADSNSWRRILDTTYDGKSLTWTHSHTASGSVYFAYFPPYSYLRHVDLVARCAYFANVFSLGHTLEGREMECVKVGQGDLKCWIIHRQHPGEHMAEFYAEGLLTRLLGLNTNGEVEGLVRDLLKHYTFYIVPNMCPDGATRGYLRTNAKGANLNREWADTKDYKAPTLERSPEVFHVLNKMEETGVDFFLDVHGDEELPFNFLSGAENTKNWGPRLESLHGAFLAAYCRANSDMQQRYGYSKPPAGTVANPCIATNAIANKFNCFSATLEMPFKDCLSNPDPERGWSPNRARMLGASILELMAYIYRYLRAEGEFWKDLPATDAYVAPIHNYKADL